MPWQLMYLSYSVPIHRYVSFVFWFMRRVGERFEWITSSGFLFAFNTVDYFVIMAAVGFFCLWFFSCVFLFCRALHAACISYGFFVVAVMSEFPLFCNVKSMHEDRSRAPTINQRSLLSSPQRRFFVFCDLSSSIPAATDPTPTCHRDDLASHCGHDDPQRDKQRW